MEYDILRKNIKEAFVTQFNLFDEPEVKKIRKSRPKMTEKEKQEKKEERELKKKIEAEKEFERKWAERGVYQGYLFDDNGESSIDEEKNNGIHIKPENKGKFNATKERTGKSTEELTHSKNPLTKKRAIFAQNAKRWKKK